MLKKLLFSAGLCLPLFASANGYIGQWHTVNENTNEVESLVSIFEEDNQLKGRIEQLANPESKGMLCDKCKGEFRDQAVEGLTFIWGLQQDGETYDDGKILDPASGKVYSASLSLIEDGQKLKVRGYLGFALLGRTQIWEKAE